MRLALVTCLLWCVAALAHAQVIAGAAYDQPTTRYPHGVLGDDVEWGSLSVVVDGGTGAGRTYTITLPEELVFEDTAPRLVDVNGDGAPEVIAVQSHQQLGARLVVLGLNTDAAPEIKAATDFIGQRNRWMAPVGVADFDGDGTLDIALVDRPHLARRLHLYRYSEGALRSYASLSPVTNHRIGDDYISGGVRDCGTGPEIIVLNAGWDRILRVVWADGGLKSHDLAPYRGRESVEAAVRCE